MNSNECEKEMHTHQGLEPLLPPPLNKGETLLEQLLVNGTLLGGSRVEESHLPRGTGALIDLGDEVLVLKAR
jgi:hypothetical protein